jgi:hypothetical protein
LARDGLPARTRPELVELLAGAWDLHGDYDITIELAGYLQAQRAVKPRDVSARAYARVADRTLCLERRLPWETFNLKQPPSSRTGTSRGD